MDLTGGSFTSDYPIDRIIYENSGSLSIPVSTGFGSFTLPNTTGIEFIPTIRYRVDNASTWYEQGNAESQYSGLFMGFVDKVAMTVVCTDSLLTVYYSNGPIATYTTMWEIKGLFKNV